jgi:hypothetical protein
LPSTTTGESGARNNLLRPIYGCVEEDKPKSIREPGDLEVKISCDSIVGSEVRPKPKLAIVEIVSERGDVSGGPAGQSYKIILAFSRDGGRWSYNVILLTFEFPIELVVEIGEVAPASNDRQSVRVEVGPCPERKQEHQSQKHGGEYRSACFPACCCCVLVGRHELFCYASPVSVARILPFAPMIGGWNSWLPRRF